MTRIRPVAVTVAVTANIALALLFSPAATAEIDARAEEMYELGVACESDLHMPTAPSVGTTRFDALNACQAACLGGFDTIDHDTPIPTIDALADACIAAHNAVPNPDPLEDIALPLAYRAAIIARCEGDETDVSAIFLNELKAINPTAAETLTQRTADILAEGLREEAEYICTPEMFDHSERMAEKALLAWQAYKAQ